MTKIVVACDRLCVKVSHVTAHRICKKMVAIYGKIIPRGAKVIHATTRRERGTVMEGTIAKFKFSKFRDASRVLFA
jgi:hypothetical protein